MDVRKRLRHRGDSSDSNTDCFHKGHEDDVSGTETMLRSRRKQLKTTTTTLASSSGSKMTWSKNDELVILGSIVDYESETKLSYRSDWDAFYGNIKDFIEANFSKQQLRDKIGNLKKRFIYNQARSNDGEGPSFTNTDDDEIFKLSVIIWATNETECASNENIDQAKDVPRVKHARVDENMDQAKLLVLNKAVHERVNENMDQKKDVPCVKHERVNEHIDEEKVVPYVKHEPMSNISMKIEKGEKEESGEDGVDEFCALQDALEAMTFYQSLGKYQQKLLLQNLKKLGAQRRKELTDEWKALLAEEHRLYVRKLSFSAKLANAGDSD